MRRLSAVTLAFAAVLVPTGVAVAHLNADGVNAASATFNATSAERFSTHTCTGADGQYQLVEAVYTGTAASSTASLAGSVRVRIKSTYNTTKKLGWAEGWLKIHDQRDPDAAINFDAVNSNGKLTGFLRGRIARNVAALRGTFTADFSTSGLSNGQLGGGGSAPNTALLTGRPCVGPTAGKSVKLTVHGTISAISAASISVTPEDGSALQTCAIGSSSPSTSGFATGQRVEMTCVTVNGTLTVTQLKKRG